MTLEKILYVCIPDEEREAFEALDARARTELRRAGKSDPGENNDLKAFEALQSLLEQKAVEAVNSGLGVAFLVSESPPPCSVKTCFMTDAVLPNSEDKVGLPRDVVSWLEHGKGVVFLSLPHSAGGSSTAKLSPIEPQAPLESWRSEAWSGAEASAERLEFQIEKILADPANPSFKINPSGVPNRVLTETLRKYVSANPGENPVSAHVEYRDGSSAPDMPLKALQFADSVPNDLPVLKFSLISIRHVELDNLVDGAWFRNSRLSVSSRNSGVTDALAYEISRGQFARLKSEGPCLIELYQTGLDTAVMGFYRALVHLLMENPKAVSVVPYHFVGSGFALGKIWSCV